MDEEPAGKPKPLFFFTMALIVLGLIGFALYRADILFPKGKDDGAMRNLTPDEMKRVQGPKEAADSNSLAMVKEYTYVPADKLPPVKGVAQYKPLNDNTVRFALNVWAGWAPIIYANQGFKPGREWVTADGKKFKVELVLIDDPVKMRDAYAAGDVHIGWATVDMLPLFMEELKKDSRTMPRVYQQIDWSNGGDGIVTRSNIKSVADLRGKTVTLAQNSPSQYFLLNALVNGGVQPSEVNCKFTADAFQAANAFAADKSIAAAVSWAPDIYKLQKLPGNKLLVTTQDANRLIADIWFARADFAKDNPAIIEGLVRGIFDAVEDLQAQDKRTQAGQWMAEGYNLPVEEAIGMLGDAHWTNYAENREFFLNENNPTNFARTWDNACFLYRAIRKTESKTDFREVADFSIVQRLGSEPKYAQSVNRYEQKFAPTSVQAIKAEANEILTKSVVIHFYPNNTDVYYKVTKTTPDGKAVEELYDPRVRFIVEEIGKIAGQFGASRIIIEGHTDASMKGTVPFAAVKELSEQRAASVKKALLEKFPSIPANQINAEGMGWNAPADPSEPNNHAKNRRVEVKVYPLEKQ